MWPSRQHWRGPNADIAPGDGDGDGGGDGNGVGDGAGGAGGGTTVTGGLMGAKSYVSLRFSSPIGIGKWVKCAPVAKSILGTETS